MARIHVGPTSRVVVSARKGGAGKTVVSVLLSRELAKRGYRVLAVDLDPQSVSASRLLGVDTSSPLHYTAVDLVEGAAGRPFAPESVIASGLDVVPANQRDLARLERLLGDIHEERKLTMGPNPRRAILDVRLASVELGYDFVVIDTPTAFGEVTSNALEAASVVVSPIDMKSAVNVESVADLDEHMAALSHRAQVFFVPNKFAKQESECREALARAQKVCGPRLLMPALMPQCTAVPQAMTHHRALQVSRESAAQLAQAFWALGQVVIESATEEALPAASGGGRR